MTRRRWWAPGVTAGLALLLAAACGGPRAQTGVSPEQALSRGQAEFQRGRFRQALEHFRRAEVLLPPRVDAVAEVRMYIAESRFQLREYLESAQAFRRIADDFPGHALAPRAIERAGDANAELWRRPELDPTYGEAALSLYRELVARYPESEAAVRARAKVQHLNDQFAEKDFKTGLFYLQRGAYDSAILYLRQLVARYPQAALVPDALLKLVEAYREIGYREELAETCAHLRRTHPGLNGLAEHCPAES